MGIQIGNGWVFDKLVLVQCTLLHECDVAWNLCYFVLHFIASSMVWSYVVFHRVNGLFLDKLFIDFSRKSPVDKIYLIHNNSDKVDILWTFSRQSFDEPCVLQQPYCPCWFTFSNKFGYNVHLLLKYWTETISFLLNCILNIKFSRELSFPSVTLFSNVLQLVLSFYRAKQLCTLQSLPQA